MKIKTSELTSAALDWAVAVCQNVELDEHEKGIWFDSDDSRVRYAPSELWAQGGPIIEREEIELGLSASNDTVNVKWFSCRNNDEHTLEMLHYASGPTPLIAAMRCYCASKLGDEVEVPDALV